MYETAVFKYGSYVSTAWSEWDGVDAPPDLRNLPTNLHDFALGWRDTVDLPTPEPNSRAMICPHCDSDLVRLSAERFTESRRCVWTPKRRDFDGTFASPIHFEVVDKARRFLVCAKCGFWYVDEEVLDTLLARFSYFMNIGIIRNLRTTLGPGINDPQIGISEVARYLGRHVSDVYTLSPRRFEELVAQIYKDLGYSVQLTQQSCDGGYDILLLECGREPYEGRHAIIECKKYAKHRAVTVGIVRQVIGVQFARGIKKAKLVTTTRFTRPAILAAKNLSAGESGYELELVDMQRLTQMLGVYENSLDLLNDPNFLLKDLRFPMTRRDAGLL